MAEHESSVRGAKYLRGRGPLRLEFAQAVGDRAVASVLEYRVKRLSRAQKQAIIDGCETLADLFEPATPDQVSGGGGG